jgi:microcystin-dependent protein
MSQGFIGEIRMFGGTFAPRGWQFCSGQIMAIAQNAALFSILGTTYGGNGQTTFALPDLRGRVPIHAGQGPGLSAYTLGESSGNETQTLNTNQLPPHTHTVQPGANNASVSATTPQGNYPGNTGFGNAQLYETSANTTMGASTSGPTGGGQALNIRQPFLCVNFIICVEGIFPSRN